MREKEKERYGARRSILGRDSGGGNMGSSLSRSGSGDVGADRGMSRSASGNVEIPLRGEEKIEDREE